MDHGSSFTSKAVKEFCNIKGIEIVYSPVNHPRATGCVERTIGSIRNFVLTYAKEDNLGSLETMVERALVLYDLRQTFSFKNSPFEVHHGREANTVLRNLTKNRQYRI